MDKRIGTILLIIALIIGAFAVVEKMNLDKITTDIKNETGSCYVGGTCLHEQSNTTFIILAVIASVVAVIGALIIILSYKKPSKLDKTENKEEAIKSATASKNLTLEQRKLYDILNEAGGSMLQGELVDKSGMNKVSVSRLLDKLEMQGIIERRRHGMSNIVVLKTSGKNLE